MKKSIKFLHTIGSVGLTGTVLLFLILLHSAPDPMVDLAGYHAIRSGMDLIARTVLLPSLTIVLTSGLAAIAVHAPFREQRWVWAKVLLGLTMFEGTLISVQGPAQQAATLTAAAMAGELEVSQMVASLHDERGALWVILTLAVFNIVLAVWRPRLKRKASATST